MRDILAAAQELVRSVWKPPAPVRLLNVTALHLTAEAETYEQTDLFAPAKDGDRRREKLELAMDAIRGKYGGGAIRYGAALPRSGEPPEE